MSILSAILRARPGSTRKCPEGNKDSYPENHLRTKNEGAEASSAFK